MMLGVRSEESGEDKVCSYVHRDWGFSRRWMLCEQLVIVGKEALHSADY